MGEAVTSIRRVLRTCRAFIGERNGLFLFTALLLVLLVMVISSLTVTSAATVGAFAGAVFTLVYVGLTYGLLRAHHEDRRYAARPVLWCSATQGDDGLRVTVENRSESLPVLATDAVVEVETTDTDAVLVRSYIGPLSPGPGVAIVHVVPVENTCRIDIFLAFDSYLGHRFAAYFRLGRSDDGALEINDAWSSAPGARAEVEDLDVGADDGFRTVLDRFRRVRLPPNVHRSISRIIDNMSRYRTGVAVTVRRSDREAPL